MLLDELNEPQRAAVTTINGPLQIIAGAGSGKTRVLTYRIAYLIEQGIKPWNIVALTFTNKAAREIQRRLAQIVTPQSANSIWAGTFHSVFARILRVEAHQIGYSNNFTIYDVEDALRALKQAKSEFHITQDTLKDSAIYAAISSAKNKMISPKQYDNAAASPAERLIAECYEAYQAVLLRNNAMDFDDILLNMRKVLDIPETLAKYQDKFHYILIDEYQDTNKVQHVIVNQLAKHRQNICVVGDDAQSIYRWRGAEISNIINFAKDFAGCKTVKLEQNYRSTKNILAAADSLLRQNKNQLKKHLWTDNEAGAKVQLSKYPTDRDEATDIINRVIRLRAGGHSIREAAVLYRTNAQALAFEKACRAANLPYVLVGGMSFYKRKEVKDVLAYLQLLVNPDDNIAATRIINEPPRGIGKTTIAQLEELATRNNCSFIKALTLITPDQFRQKKNYGTLIYLNDLINKHTALCAGPNDPRHLAEYIEKTGLRSYYTEIDDAESRDRLANIGQLVSDVVEFLESRPGSSLQDYLEQISLINDLDAKELDEERLTLMTLHAAKGLEYEHVFIAGIEGGMLPLGSAQSAAEIEEERRLLYVGITRARRALWLSYTAMRYKFGQQQYNQPSYFLTEIEADLFADSTGNTFLSERKQSFREVMESGRTRFGGDTSGGRPSYPVFNDMEYEENYSQIPPDFPTEANAKSSGAVVSNTSRIEREDSPRGLAVGDAVVHSKFGQGRIVAMDGSGHNAKVVVFFGQHGRKQLMAQYANLRKL